MDFSVKNVIYLQISVNMLVGVATPEKNRDFEDCNLKNAKGAYTTIYVPRGHSPATTNERGGV